MIQAKSFRCESDRQIYHQIKSNDKTDGDDDEMMSCPKSL